MDSVDNTALRKQINRHLQKKGWNNGVDREDFINNLMTLIDNSKTQSARQVLKNYLQKGTNVLNIELKRDAMGKQEVEVDTGDDESNDNNIQQESIIKAKKILEVYKKSKRYKKLRENKENKKKSNVDMNRGKVHANNFKIFSKNYLNSKGNWNTENVNEYLNSIISLVNGATGNTNKQYKISSSIDNFVKKFDKKLNGSLGTEDENYETSIEEIKLLSLNYRGWTSEPLNKLISFVSKGMTSKIDNDLQKKIVSFLGSLDNIQAEKQEKKDSKKDSEKTKNKKDTKDNKEKSKD